MHEFEYQLESSIHDLHTSRRKLPLNFAIHGEQQVCEQIDIHEKKMQHDMLFHTTNKRIRWPRFQSRNLKQHMAIKIHAPTQVETSTS